MTKKQWAGVASAVVAFLTAAALALSSHARSGDVEAKGEKIGERIKAVEVGQRYLENRLDRIESKLDRAPWLQKKGD